MWAGLHPDSDYWWAVWAIDGEGQGTPVSEWRRLHTAPDADGDGASDLNTLTDCRPHDPLIHPPDPWTAPVVDVCYNGIDEDCSDVDAPVCGLAPVREQQGVRAVFIAEPDNAHTTAATLRTRLRLISGEGCWYLAEPDFSTGGNIDNTEVHLLPPWGDKLIAADLAVGNGQHYRLNLSMNNPTTNIVVALDVILRGLFSQRLADILASNDEAFKAILSFQKEIINATLEVIKENGTKEIVPIVDSAGNVWPLVNGLVALKKGEFTEAGIEFVDGFAKIAKAIGDDRMNQIFTNILGNAGKFFWQKGVGTILESFALFDKYNLLKEIVDSYVRNHCSDPIDGEGYVQLSTKSTCAPCALTLWYKDADNDGYSDGTVLVQQDRPLGYKTSVELAKTREMPLTAIGMMPTLRSILGRWGSAETVLIRMATAMTWLALWPRLSFFLPPGTLAAVGTISPGRMWGGRPNIGCTGARSRVSPRAVNWLFPPLPPNMATAGLRLAGPITTG